jgi:hypothetical protein
MTSDAIAQFLSATITGLVVGLGVVFLNRNSETIKQFQILKMSAYSDFIRGIAGLAILQNEPIEEMREHVSRGREYKALVADAKARIAIYGDETVVSSLAQFLRGGSILDTPERNKEFTSVCQKMRADDSAAPPSNISDETADDYASNQMNSTSFRWPSKWKSMASRMSCCVSFFVFPVVTSPGRSGT